jgi:predicted GH43/DUF377 family glycosyl hydrolase
LLAPDPAHAWESVSAFNASVQRGPDGRLHLLYRATNRARFWDEPDYASSIGHATSLDGVTFDRRAAPLLSPAAPYELPLGCEDPRLMRIDGRWVVLYTAVEGPFGGQRVRIACATVDDGFSRVERHGIVGPDTGSKAAALVEHAGRELSMLWTFQADSPLSTILESRYASLDHLLSGDREPVLRSLMRFEEHVVLGPTAGDWRGPELGAVPVATEHGLLFVLCPETHTRHDEWTIGAALLDPDDPRRVLARTSEPLLAPTTETEQRGVMPNVTFPSGALIVGDELHVYYGAGDTDVNLATMPLAALYAALGVG